MVVWKLSARNGQVCRPRWRPCASTAAGPVGSGSHDPVLAALGFDPVTLDALVARTGWPAADLNVRLLDLELEGRVIRLPGQLFQRLVHG